MFRRSPLLGAAVVYGASRSAARREVDRNEMRNAEMQREADRRMYEQEQRMRRDQERQDRRESERRDRDRERDAGQEARTQRAIDTALAQERTRMAGAYGGPVQGGYSGQQQQMHPGMPMAGVPQLPPSGQGRGEGGRNCTACGNRCRREDKFCGNCGNRLS